MTPQWKKIPASRSEKYVLTDEFVQTTIRLPARLLATIDAVAAQLRKDRKHLILKSADRPAYPSRNSLINKAVELMFWPEKGAKTKHGKE